VPARPAAHTPPRPFRIEQLLEQFAVDPGDRRSFELLQEHLFLSGSWSQLAGVYECRLSALPPGSGRVDLLLRLAELLSERLGDSRGALARLEEALQEQPREPRVLAGLRRLRRARGELAAALQIGELEESIPRPDAERAQLLAELGELWLELGERREAGARLEEALRLAPECEAALRGLATLAELESRPQAAVALHERRLPRLSGGARADALEHLIRLLPDAESERRRALLRELAREFPDRPGVLERLIALERAAGDAARVDELQRARWDAVRDPAGRLQLALEEATYQLQEAGDAAAAAAWLDRAHALRPQDARVQELRVRAFRRLGHPASLIDALERLEHIAGVSPLRALELGILHEREGRPESAITWLEAALEQEPRSAEALAALDRCLARLGRSDQRARLLERRIAAAEQPAQAVELLAELGALHRQAPADFASTERAYRRALELDPEHAASLAGLRGLLREQQRHPALAELLEHVARRARSPRARAAAHCELGDIHLEPLADLAGARSAYLAALELEPGCAEALRGLRRAAEHSADPALLLEACERELAAGPTPEREPALLAELVERARGAGDLLRARAAARRWAALEPLPEPQLRLAELARALGDGAGEAQALEDADALLDDAPRRRALVRIRLGDLSLEQADPEALELAARWYARALAIVPDAALRARLIDLYRTLGRLPELAQELRTHLAQLSGAPARRARLELARALEGLGDPEAAVAALRPAFEDQPADPQVADLLEQLLGKLGDASAQCEVLQRRLDCELDPAQRRELAERLATLLLDGLQRAARAAQVAGELADATRDETLERLYARALEASGAEAELERWLSQRQIHVEGPARIPLLLRIAGLRERQGRIEPALEALSLALRSAASGPELDATRSALVALVSRHGSPPRQLQALDSLLERTPEPRPRAALLLERARLRSQSLGDSAGALADLEQFRRLGAPGVDALRQALSICEPQGPLLSHRLSLLEQLGEQGPDPAERRAAQLEAAALRSAGPPELRDPAAAASLLRGLLARDPTDRVAFARLAELLEAQQRDSELSELLISRLERSDLELAERASLALRAGQLALERGQAAAAVELLGQARSAGPSDGSSAELLHVALKQTGDASALERLCAEQARATRGGARRLWLARWLRCIEAGPAAAATRDELIEEALTRAEREDAELLEALIPLVDWQAEPASGARALELALSRSASLAPGRRRLWLRQLLDLYEGPLEQLGRALVWIEREVERDPGLRERGVRLARRLGEAEREVGLLEPLAAAGDPRAARALGLARLRAGRGDAAAALLWSALQRDPGDDEVLQALAERGPRSAPPDAWLRLAEARFARAPAEEQRSLAASALDAAGQQGDGAAQLRWARRLCALPPVSPADLASWLELERQAGQPAQLRRALDAALELTADPPEQARLLATRGELEAATGDLERARRSFSSALELVADPPLPWIEAQDQILARLGRSSERIELVRALADAPQLPAAERAVQRERLVTLLASQPALRGQAARELESLLDRQSLGAPEQLRRAHQLLELYGQLGWTTEWCALAGELAPCLPAAERTELQRERARRLGRELGAVDEAIAAWEPFAAGEPPDREALEALCELRQRPGDEAVLTALLERRAAAEPPGAPGTEQLWLQAARLHWAALGDATAALAAAERALECSPGLGDAHALRSEVCGRLDRAHEEARSLRALLEQEPRGPMAADRWLRLAQLAARSPEGAEEARSAARRTLQAVTPLLPAIRREVRRVLERCGSPLEAAELLREELEVAEPAERPELLRHLTELSWDELRDASQARHALEALAAVAPLAESDHRRWADVCEALGDRAGYAEHRWQVLEAEGSRARAGAWAGLGAELWQPLGDAARARQACDRALELDPRCLEALRLRIELRGAQGDVRGQLDDCLELAGLLPEGPQQARALCEAAALCAEGLGDPARAWALYRQALRSHPNWTPALVAGGRISLARGEWAQAQRMLGQACALLAGDEEPLALAEIARLAARAAQEAGDGPEALRYLELASQAQPDDPETLDAMAALGLRLGAYERAQTCLERRLALGGLTSEQRSERLARLAHAAQSACHLERAAQALAEAVELRPGDEVSRARLVDVLERLGRPDEAVAQLEAWAAHAPADIQPQLGLRAAQLEISAQRRDAARRRLEALVQLPAVPARAWLELAELALGDTGPTDALRIADQGLACAGHGPERGALLWVRARALRELGDRAGAAQGACETLALCPTNLEAARLLCENLGYAGDWRSAVQHIECALDLGHPPPDLEAELWEATGRAYAGPLEDVQRAQRSYRRALEANPRRSAAREALADLTAFDPASHGECVALHRELLERYPARPGSWRALRRIAEHWSRSQAALTCDAVLEALTSSVSSPAAAPPALSIELGAPPGAAAGGIEILLAQAESSELPPPPAATDAASVALTPLLRGEVLAICGPGWDLSDAQLGAAWRRAAELANSAEELPRKPRRRLRRAVQEVGASALERLEPTRWRCEVAAWAAARLLQRGEAPLRDLLLGLLGAWAPARDLEALRGADLGPALQSCPPARLLLWRIARVVVAQLGL
jgi:tetratricopeptide (TPR) repeat protein